MRMFGIVEWIIVAILSIFAAWLIWMGVYYGADRLFLRGNVGIATINEVVEHPEWTQFLYTGKVTVPIFHPKTYGIIVQIDDMMGEIPISQEQARILNSSASRNPIKVHYDIGRFSKTLYVTHVE